VAGASDANAAALANPDFDAWSNLFEYATGTDPRSAAHASPVPFDIETIGSARYLRLTVTKNASATDVVTEVQATSDLSDAGIWSSTGLVIETNTATLLRVRDNVPIGTGPIRYLRVKVTH
jgi:hypothetical protein